jgi:hypothetical protein
MYIRVWYVFEKLAILVQEIYFYDFYELLNAMKLIAY